MTYKYKIRMKGEAEEVQEFSTVFREPVHIGGRISIAAKRGEVSMHMSMKVVAKQFLPDSKVEIVINFN